MIAWDDEDDEGGNVRHIATADLTPAEVEDVLYDPASLPDASRSTGRPVLFGRTSTGKFIVVVYEVEETGGLAVL